MPPPKWIKKYGSKTLTMAFFFSEFKYPCEILYTSDYVSLYSHLLTNYHLQKELLAF